MQSQHPVAPGRRAFIAGAGALVLAGCTSTRQTEQVAQRVMPPEPPSLQTPPMYYAMPNERFPIPAVDVSRVDPKWWRTELEYPTGEKVGTVIVDTPNRYLYHVRPGGRAIRYGVGVGRDG